MPTWSPKVEEAIIKGRLLRVVETGGGTYAWNWSLFDGAKYTDPLLSNGGSKSRHRARQRAENAAKWWAEREGSR